MRWTTSLVALSTILLCWNGTTHAVIAVDGTFRLQRLTGDNWFLELCYDGPVDAVRFDRPVDDFRRSSWAAADSVFELNVDEKGVAVLRRKDRAKFDCAAINLQTWTHRPEKNYYAFSPFSDGGISVYTGYYIPSVLRDGEWEETLLTSHHPNGYSGGYKGLEGDQVITRDPYMLVEQFVYFGQQPVLETPALVAVIDPAMPGNARKKILETVPAVNLLLEEKFDFRPESPYMVFMATELDVFDGFSSKGGALKGQVLFTLKGRQVSTHLEKNPDHYSKTTAHEVIHLWQWDQWPALGEISDDQPWIHEGSADALAYEIMRATGVYNEQQYQVAWQDTEAECAKLLRKSSIHSGPERGQFDVVYRCGAVVNRYIGSMLNPEDAGAGTIRFWQAMAAWPQDEHQRADEALVFRTLETLGIDKPRINALREFLDLQTDAPEEALAALRKTLFESVEKT